MRRLLQKNWRKAIYKIDKLFIGCIDALNMKLKIFLILTILILFPFCQKDEKKTVPQEALESLTTSLNYLKNKKVDKFLELIIPRELAKAENPENQAGIEIIKGNSFFEEIQDYKIHTDRVHKSTDTEVTILVEFTYKEYHNTQLFFSLKKINGKWLIDLNEMFRLEKLIKQGGQLYQLFYK